MFLKKGNLSLFNNGWPELAVPYSYYQSVVQTKTVAKGKQKNGQLLHAVVKKKKGKGSPFNATKEPVEYGVSARIFFWLLAH